MLLLLTHLTELVDSNIMEASDRTLYYLPFSDLQVSSGTFE
jgi:hypothetical protein